MIGLPQAKTDQRRSDKACSTCNQNPHSKATFSRTAPNPGAEFVVYRYCISEAALTSYSDSQPRSLGFTLPGLSDAAIFPSASDPIGGGSPKLEAIGRGRHAIRGPFQHSASAPEVTLLVRIVTTWPPPWPPRSVARASYCPRAASPLGAPGLSKLLNSSELGLSCFERAACHYVQQDSGPLTGDFGKGS